MWILQKIGGNLNEFHFLDDFGYQRKTSKTLKPLKALDIISNATVCQKELVCLSFFNQHFLES